MGPQKIKNEEIVVFSRWSFLWEARYGSKKKTEMVYKIAVGLFVVVVVVAAYGNEVMSVGGHRKNTDLRNCSSLLKQYTKPRTKCAQGEDQISATTAMAAVAAAKDEHFDCK